VAVAAQSAVTSGLFIFVSLAPDDDNNFDRDLCCTALHISETAVVNALLVAPLKGVSFNA
jgi:hypothetical protein